MYFTLVVTIGYILLIDVPVPVTGFQLSDQLAFGYLSAAQEPERSHIIS